MPGFFLASPGNFSPNKSISHIRFFYFPGNLHRNLRVRLVKEPRNPKRTKKPTSSASRQEKRVGREEGRRFEPDCNQLQCAHAMHFVLVVSLRSESDPGSFAELGSLRPSCAAQVGYTPGICRGAPRLSRALKKTVPAAVAPESSMPKTGAGRASQRPQIVSVRTKPRK